MRILTWNLFHGRGVPDRPHPLGGAFARLLNGWDWDAALLQEVPPWWPEQLAAACGAQAFTARTSRNQVLPLARVFAARRPDIIKSWGGGSNAILVRGAAVTTHAQLRLRLRPERRVVHAVRREDGLWLANLHASAYDRAEAQVDIGRAAQALRRWAGDEPVVLGGDMNTRGPQVPGFAHAGGHVIDHVFARGLAVAAPARTLERDGLSDHAPVLAVLRLP
jgi:endonuclease/exonuclease/phosphatase (EEP) superfamily protein YafD